MKIFKQQNSNDHTTGFDLIRDLEQLNPIAYKYRVQTINTNFDLNHRLR